MNSKDQGTADAGRSPLLLVTLMTLAGCMGAADHAPAPTLASQPERNAEMIAAEEGEMGSKDDKESAKAKQAAPAAPPMAMPATRGAVGRADGLGGMANIASVMDDPAPGKGGDMEEAAPTRAWFPESFLFAPVILTDEKGQASLDVMVPDQLTTWRILALAHNRVGSQAGSETRFASTLPLYVDVVLPPSLRVGDKLLLPVQAVNQAAEPWSGRVDARVTGAAKGGGAGNLALPAGGSRVQYVAVEAVLPGEATVSVSLGGADRVERTLTIKPTGRPLERAQGGTLASARSFEMPSPANALSGASTLDLVVYPGPLSVLDAEMDLAPRRGGGLAWTSYGFALSGSGRDVAKRLGAKVDESKLRLARLRAYQGMVKLTRSPGFSDAVIALDGARTQPDDSLAQALAQRLATQILAMQSPDGSFAGAWGGSASLEYGLGATAEASRIAGALQIRIPQRAASFVGRHAAEIQDPYTAAVVLQAGLAPSTRVEALRKLVRDAVETRPDGSRVLNPSAKARRIDRSTPGTAETTARAILALKDDPAAKELLPDMGSALLGFYRPATGFGDGLTGLVVLQALAVLFDQPLPESVTVRLEVDGQEALVRPLDLAAGFTPLVSRAAAPGTPGPHSYRVVADPPVPGLMFTLTGTWWLPWSPEDKTSGFTLRVEPPPKSSVGSPIPLVLKAAVPGGEAFTMELDLPAGLDVDKEALARLVTQGTLTSFESSEGHLVLKAPALSAGAAFQATIEVIPTLAGSFSWGGASLFLARDPDRRTDAALTRWNVTPPG